MTVIGRFIRVLFRCLRGFFRPIRFLRFYNFPKSGAFSGFRYPPKAGAEELSNELDLDLDEAGEPMEPLPHSDLSEEERQEAVRRYQDELAEKERD